MAEVENMSAATASAADIPKLSSNDGGAAELGTSPAQERSSNSHPHDSEYDTASDLEGGEHDDYDDDDDEEDDEGDESLSDEDDDDDDEDDDEEEDTDENRQRGTEGGTDKADDVQKKVDEDRSNPQYIPKRGTFYEHDDRTAEGAEGAPVQAVDAAEDSEVNGTNPQSPTAISHASKTMKKWQPASGVDRWSHDRFDPNEQAPKSRSELVSAYGYDIRNEDAPPRARRRRRYGKGPSKYSRNWEDETAYLKASNTPRRPPRPSDFPALNERKPRKTNSVKEEKENHLDRRQVPDGEKTTTNSAEVPQQRTSRSGERRERDPQRKGSNNKNKTFGRNQPVGRQAAMEFKNKQRPNHSQGGHGPSPNTPQNRLEQQQTERNQPRSQNSQSNDEMRSSDKPPSKHVHPQQNDANETPYVKVDQGQKQSNQHVQSSNHNARNQPKSLPASNLSARLQQLQNRNDPSHVGSVQMHALANHNQLVGQQQQANLMLAHQQQQQQQQLPVSTATNHPDQGRPKRYSSIRRSQHDTQNIDQQHQMQQLHMQQQQQVAPQPILIQDQHMLQANLMQLYHQENLQAQMQALQVSAGLQAGAPSQQPGPQKPPTYATVPPAAQQPPQPPQYAAAGAGGAPTAYYVAAPEAYAATAVAGQAPPPAQYPQPPTGYIQGTPAPTGPPIAYASPPPQQAVGATAGVAPVVPLAYGGPNPVPGSAPAPANAAPPTAGQPGYQNYANYQNYNTVGGTTYFVPPAQATTRPVVLPQRRPTNAIPILPPSEKSKQRSQPEGKEDQSKNSNVSSTSATGPEAPLGSAENIDHIIDNMFVQRPAYQPPPTQARKSTSPPPPVKEDAPSASGGGDSNSGPTPAPAQSTSNTSQAEEVPNEKQSNIEPADSNNAAVAKEAI